MKTCTHPIVAMLAGVMPAASPCPGLGFALQPQDNPAPDEVWDLTPDTASAPAWVWPVVALAGAALIYAAWPKPEREARRVKRRQATAEYRKRLEEIGREKTAPSGYKFSPKARR